MTHIRHLYSQYPSLFIKLIKNHFQFHFRLHKKYNEANKSLGTMGAGLTTAKLQERLEMKKLLDKIVTNFPWWEDLHGFWRTNPSYNRVFSTADPGQDFAVSAQQYFSGQQGTTVSKSLLIVGDGWASSKPSPVIGDDGLEGEEGEVGEDIEEGDLHGDDMMSFSGEVLDANINLQLHPPLSTYSTASTLSTPSPFVPSVQSVLVDTNTLPTAGMLNTLSSHAQRASTGTGISMGREDKGKSPTGVNSTSLSVPSWVPSSSGSSAACKQSRDDSAEANSQTKWLKIQVLVVAKELKAHDKNAQHEHDLKVKIMENDHKLSMAGEKMKKLQLELELERVRLAQLQAERNPSPAGDGE
ncbi:hypothetical protein EDC04DRAFT_2891416 [Pisolithus marmoratus]|nr:hypothetical protein EDC04DRAFT_2891416 [Pisolithus marmoratus]